MPETLEIMTVVGARPQFIKAAVVSRAIAGHNAAPGSRPLREAIVHTGQHYDYGMNDVFFKEMEIPEPVANLSVGSGRHGAMTAEMLKGLEREMIARRPDVVLIYGDTNSTLAAALAAAKLDIPVAHVEAGMRSFNRRMPEEINRVLSDHVSSLLLCSSEVPRAHLAAEGITEGVHVVGDVMYDAALHYRARAPHPEGEGPFALCTMHRAENTDDPARLDGIFAALAKCPVRIVFPAHPRTVKAIEKYSTTVPDNVEMVAPLSYFEMLGRLEATEFVLTDSGGLQKEAYYFGKKCITMREETEWTELVDIGANRLVGADTAKIAGAYGWAAEPLEETQPVYGSGDAGMQVARILAEAL